AAKEKDPDFDIKRNLFGNLGDDLITYQKAPTGTSAAELNSPPGLILIGSPKADQLAAALKSILILVNQEGTPPVEREFLGRKIFSAHLPAGLLGGNPRATTQTLSYAASGGYVALTTDTAMLEEYLRSSDSKQKALRDASGLVDATGRIGGSGTG